MHSIWTSDANCDPQLALARSAGHGTPALPIHALSTLRPPHALPKLITPCNGIGLAVSVGVGVGSLFLVIQTHPKINKTCPSKISVRQRCASLLSSLPREDDNQLLIPLIARAACRWRRVCAPRAFSTISPSGANL